MKKIICMISALALMTAPLTAYAKTVAENYLNDDEEPLVIKHTDEHRFRYTKVTTTVS